MQIICIQSEIFGVPHGMCQAIPCGTLNIPLWIQIHVHTDNIKAVLRFQLNIPCGMLIISMRRLCVLSKAEKRKIFKMADILLGKCSKTVIENPQKSIKGIKEI